MTFTLPLEPKEEAKLIAAAWARGVSPGALVHEALGRIFADADVEVPGKEPTPSLRGIFAIRTRPCGISSRINPVIDSEFANDGQKPGPTRSRLRWAWLSCLP